MLLFLMNLLQEMYKSRFSTINHFLFTKNRLFFILKKVSILMKLETDFCTNKQLKSNNENIRKLEIFGRM